MAPVRNPGYVNLGYVCERKGDLDKAVELCEKAISLDKNLTRAYDNLAVAFGRKKNMTRPGML
ncbi:MAG TPA: tetratricopeptide repeat protein [bacterium]|nr:tetratricopeptide repeat protein [bacterium]HQL61460.1 tetratricopeptide repeat protein [bacterium]